MREQPGSNPSRQEPSNALHHRRSSDHRHSGCPRRRRQCRHRLRLSHDPPNGRVQHAPDPQGCPSRKEGPRQEARQEARRPRSTGSRPDEQRHPSAGRHRRELEPGLELELQRPLARHQRLADRLVRQRRHFPGEQVRAGLLQPEQRHLPRRRHDAPQRDRPVVDLQWRDQAIHRRPGLDQPERRSRKWRLPVHLRRPRSPRLHPGRRHAHRQLARSLGRWPVLAGRW